jgi:glycerol-3-phosphate dehydrogenase
MYRRLRAHSEPWDMIVVGGGATGAGVAIDAATRGYDVLLLEQHDFGKGTSSRSTKLIHGGVRYLEQGNLSLVMEALKERGVLLQNTIRTEGLRGGVIYFDGQFDDSRLLINLVTTAFEQGATLLNYAPVMGVSKDADGFVDGVRFRDVETGEGFEARGRVVINATGPFSDDLRRRADPAVQSTMVPSQGIHLVFDKSFLTGDSAIMVPHTSDGRVLFAIPWHGHTLVGTTDTPVAEATLEPVAMEQEIEFILQTAALYLAKRPTHADVLSVFAGIRPLVRSNEASNTAALSRDHTIRIENSGMITVSGGKWTTYRHMAEDCVNLAATLARLPEKPCVTAQLHIHGYHRNWAQFGALAVYGCDAVAVRALMDGNPSLAEPLNPALPYTGAEVIWAARHEMARTVEDVLARRTRALFLNARAAIGMAPRVAELLSREFEQNQEWQVRQVEMFHVTARNYLLPTPPNRTTG